MHYVATAVIVLVVAFVFYKAFTYKPKVTFDPGPQPTDKDQSGQ